MVEVCVRRSTLSLVGCGVVRGEPELIEAVLVQLDLGAVGDVKPKRNEDLEHLVSNAGDGVKPARHLPAARQSHVEGGAGELRLASAAMNGFERRVEGRLNLLLERVGCLAELAAPVPGQLRHELEELGKIPLRPHVARVDQPELGLIACSAQRLRVGAVDFGKPILERLNRIRLCHCASGAF